MPLAVNDPNDEINALRLEWQVVEPLMGGTQKMRDAGVGLLPRWPAEDESAYQTRLRVATLFPAYRRTVGVMGGKPFSKPLDVVDAPPQIEQWCEDIDLQNINLHAFAAEMFQEVMAYGMAGIMVSMQRAAAEPARSLAEEQASGRRPYFVRVMHNQILGWKLDKSGGTAKLAQLRIMESIDEDDGPFGVKCVQQVRVLEPGAWSVWREIEPGKWVLAEEGTTSLNVVPFVPLYGLRKALMVGGSPMLDLAFLNVKHWQSQSDQDTIMHVARVPILAMIGADDQTQLALGGASAVRMPAGSELKYIEHGGHAIKAGEDALNALEQQMIQTGAELLIKQPGTRRTATESITDAEANKSDLQRMAEGFEDALDQALDLLGQFASITKAGNVKMYADYGTGTLSEASAALIKDLHLSGLVSAETAITELQRRGVLSDDIDPVEELAKIDAEGLAPGEIVQPGVLGGGTDTSAVDGANN